MSPYLKHLINYLRYSSWLIPNSRHNLLQSITSCHFWARPNFVPVVCTTLTIVSCHLELHVEYLSFSDSLICSFHFSFPVMHQLQRLSQLQQNLFPLQFTLCDVVIIADAAPYHWAIYFLCSGLPLSFSRTWSDSMHYIHTALQELQAVALCTE